MRVPITGYGVARLTHAPNAAGLFKTGVVQYEPADGMLFTMCDGPNQLGAAWTTGLIPVMGFYAVAGSSRALTAGRSGPLWQYQYLLHQRYGSRKGKAARFGGAPDIAAMAGRLVIIINYQKHRLIEKVDFITSPNILDCGAARKKAVLPGGGPAVIITDGGILQPYGPTNAFHLASIHPGHSLAEIQQNTGWTLQSMPDVAETPPQPKTK